MLDVTLKNLLGRGALDDHRRPIPSQPMLAKRVVFLPLFLGTLKKTRLPWGE